MTGEMSERPPDWSSRKPYVHLPTTVNGVTLQQAFEEGASAVLPWGKSEGRQERGQEIVAWLKDIAVRLDYADAGNLAVRLKAWLAQQGDEVKND